MAEKITNYKCPACDGGLKFVGASGKLECEYCGSTFAVADIEARYAEAAAKAAEAFAEEETEEQEETPWDTSELKQWDTTEGMRTYTCPSCAAEMICEETTAATACPYCGNPAIVPGQFSGGLKPNYVLPFKLSQEEAEKALSAHYKGKKFLPSSFAAENTIKELKGIYVPFWLFDGKVDITVAFDATRTHHYRQGNSEITETQHFDVRRAGVVPFEMIPVDGSTKMPDAYMDAIEPFDYQELREFSDAYLPGYLADKYDVTAEESAKRADDRAVNTAVDAMRADVRGYGTCVMRSKTVKLHRDKVHYGLLPVYMLSTTWQGKSYLFAMNGQTGKLVGKLPVDWRKFWSWFGGITLGVTAVLGTLLFLFLQ